MKQVIFAVSVVFALVLALFASTYFFGEHPVVTGNVVADNENKEKDSKKVEIPVEEDTGTADNDETIEEQNEPVPLPTPERSISYSGSGGGSSGSSGGSVGTTPSEPAVKEESDIQFINILKKTNKTESSMPAPDNIPN